MVFGNCCCRRNGPFQLACVDGIYFSLLEALAQQGCLPLAFFGEWLV